MAENKSDAQRQSGSNDKGLAPAQDAGGEQSTSSGGNGGSTANTEGLSQEALDLLNKLGNQKPYEQTSQDANGSGIGFGSINQ